MIIAFTGRIHSGKTTLAKYLVNMGYEKVSFADPLKKISQELFDFNDEQLYGNLKEVIDPRIGMTPRYVLQYIGTELFRNWNKNFWVEVFQRKHSDPKLLVLDDVRFDNEEETIHKLGGIVIKVKSHKYEKISNHASEKGIKNYDYKIYNDGTYEELYEALRELLQYHENNNSNNNEND